MDKRDPYETLFLKKVMRHFDFLNKSFLNLEEFFFCEDVLFFFFKFLNKKEYVIILQIKKFISRPSRIFAPLYF